MRRILIDNARKRKATNVAVSNSASTGTTTSPENPTDDLLAIDEALTLLAAEDTESALLVNLRYYAGLSVDEAADVMGMARATAYRTWMYAKAWLRTKLADVSTD